MRYGWSDRLEERKPDEKIQVKVRVDVLRRALQASRALAELEHLPFGSGDDMGDVLAVVVAFAAVGAGLTPRTEKSTRTDRYESTFRSRSRLRSSSAEVVPSLGEEP